MLSLDKELDPYTWTTWHVMALRSRCISVHLMGLVYTTVAIMKMPAWSAAVSKFCCSQMCIAKVSIVDCKRFSCLVLMILKLDYMLYLV